MNIIDQCHGDGWVLYNGDSCEVLKGLPSASVDLACFSPPFSSLYTYSPLAEDLGNCKDDAEFFAHFGFVTRELVRVLRPGRHACVHVQQLTTTKATHGVIGMKDFRGDVIRHFQSHGFIFHGEVTIDKALRNGEPVLTPDGWKPIEQIRKGDHVFGGNGRLTRVLDVLPQGTHPMYRVTLSDGTSVECSPSHLWTVRPDGRAWSCKPSRQWITLRTDELAACPRTPNGRPRYEIPIAPAVQYPATSLPIDPYLLGALIGDGSISGRHIEMTTEPEVAAACSVAHGCHIAERPYGAKGEMRRSNPTMDALRSLKLMGCRAWEKFIPEAYKRGTPTQRLALLRGLMDTDGTCKKRGQACFATTSQALATDVAEIVTSLGGLALIRTEETGHRLRWVVSVQMPPGTNPFKMERKAARWRKSRAIRRMIVSVELTGERHDCTCIRVEAVDGLFLTRGHVVTHNCPQSQAIRTKSKSLLFVQLRKDSSWLRPALADYILVFRAPGENAVPIQPDITNDDWIQWARPIWYGIKETETLNVTVARQDKDERHICPLQLETIERCIRLWSNKGEVVLSPFAGIGSECYVSLLQGRRAIGIELKPEYAAVAARNLREAEARVKLPALDL